MDFSKIDQETKKEYSQYKNRVKFIREHVLQFTTVDQFALEIVARAPQHKISAKTLSEIEKSGLPKADINGNQNGVYKDVASRTQVKLFHALNTLLGHKGLPEIKSRTELFKPLT